MYLHVIRLERYSYQPKLEKSHPQMLRVYRISTQIKNIHPQMYQISPRYNGIPINQALENISADISYYIIQARENISADV